MKLSHLLFVFLTLFAFVLVSGSLFTVGEQEQAIITRFGKPQGDPIIDAGLHFKTPFIEDINRIPKNILQWDGPSTGMTTKDKSFIVVDAFARWRITDPLLYFQSLRDERTAQSRLDGILNSEVANVIASHDLIEVVRTDKTRKPTPDDSPDAAQVGELPVIKFGREALEKQILKASLPSVKPLGIELLDLRFKRINYKPEVIEKIYASMISERDQIAQGFLSEGRSKAAEKTGEKERDLAQIQSKAYKQVQEIQGKADAEATEIYAKAYNTSPLAGEFYQFVKTMETYKATIGRDTTLILTTDSDLFKFFKHIDGGKGKATVIKPAPPAPAVPSQP